MGSANAKAVDEAGPPAVNQSVTEKPKCKACCACPETKQVRDKCIIENGEEQCGKEIEDHKVCMRNMGFNI